MDVTHVPSAAREVTDHPVQETTATISDGVTSAFDGNSVQAVEVTFQPGERTKYHTHAGVQVLYVTGGEGVVATREQERTVSTGDLVVFDPGEEHWHGTGEDADAPFSHISFIAEPEGAEMTVLETA